MGNKTSGVIDKTPVRTPNIIHLFIQDEPEGGAYRYCASKRGRVTSCTPNGKRPNGEWCVVCRTKAALW